MPDTKAEKKKRKGCGCATFTAGCLAGFIALPVFLLLCAFAAWQFSSVKQAVYIGMLHVSPRETMKLRAAERLEKFPDDKTKIALVVFVNRATYGKDKAVAMRALATLCKISGQNFGTAYTGSNDMSILESLTEEDWKTVKSNVLRWAFQTLRKEGQPFPIPMPETPHPDRMQINTPHQTQPPPPSFPEED